MGGGPCGQFHSRTKSFSMIHGHRRGKRVGGGKLKKEGKIQIEFDPFHFSSSFLWTQIFLPFEEKSILKSLEKD